LIGRTTDPTTVIGRGLELDARTDLRATLKWYKPKKIPGVSLLVLRMIMIIIMIIPNNSLTTTIAFVFL
jgi:hypothetical protein